MMNNFETADRLIKEYSEQLLLRIDGFVKDMSNDNFNQNLFLDYLWMIIYEFDGFCRAFEAIGYISIVNRFEYNKSFSDLVNKKSEKIHKEKGWIFISYYFV